MVNEFTYYFVSSLFLKGTMEVKARVLVSLFVFGIVKGVGRFKSELLALKI